MNTAMSYNALSIAAELGIQRVVMASSVNSIGMREYLFRPPSPLSYTPADTRSLLQDASVRLSPAGRAARALPGRRVLTRQAVSTDSSHNPPSPLASPPPPPLSLLRLCLHHHTPCSPCSILFDTSLTPSASELQASALTRRNPHLPLRIASLRFHWVVPTPLATPSSIASHLGSPKDLFGWVSVSSASEAVLLALTAPLTTFPAGHEAFFIVARTLCGGRTREEAIAELAGGVEWRGGEEGMRGNGGLFDTRKAERMLGWVDEGYPIE